MLKITRKRLLILAGTVFTVIGIVGIFVPILPTTPFLLLAAACYLRGSEKFYHWLLNNKLFGFYIRNYIEGKGMPLKMKLFTLTLLWLSIGISIWIGTQNLTIRIILVLVAAGVTVHIITIKKRKINKTSNKINLTKGDIDILDEKSTTRDTYNLIAASRYNFRHYSRFQTELERLAQRWRQGNLLNVGCAHGPDFPPFKESFELHGVDYSSEMLKLAQKYADKHQFKVNLQEADARNLPYADGFFDFAIAIAVYHHIDDKEGRTQALKELYRVLKPGGEAFITVWNRWQPRHWLQKKSFMRPWKTRDKKLYRFYYLFTYREFEKLVRQAGFEIIKSSPEARYKFPLKTFSRNICLLVRKS
jgi:uncharacterized membrane protein YbaN (DUF454 family)/ubiquinone/menaquinone biosynthesis C-methylase UbiE